MFRCVAVIMALVFLPKFGFAQVVSGIPDAYAKAGWKQLFEAKGDLNKDGIDDKALAIQAPEGIKEPGNWCHPDNAFSEAPARRLIIWLSKADGSFSIANDDAITLLRSDEGGVFGDPLEDLSIERGALVINYYGGSRWRWGYTQRFRLEEDGFALIGYTDFSTDIMGNAVTSYDYNALSGKVLVDIEEAEDEELRKTNPLCIQCRIGELCPASEQCFEGTKRGRTGKTWYTVGKKPLVKLEDFRCWEEETGLMKHTGFNNER